MSWIAEAFQRNWFYVGALVIGVIYGLGGVEHLGNILGFGEMEWSEAPLSRKLGDLGWGALDVLAVVGIALKWPAGLVALIAAAATQVIVYALLPDAFALTDAHRATLRGLVWFNAVVLIVVVAALVVTVKNGTA